MYMDVRKGYMNKRFLITFFVLFVWIWNVLSIETLAEEFRYAPDKDGELIVVLDPGHGGENLGADYEGVVEKEINMILANAMYEHLRKYDGITVYLTRTEDVDLSLKERAEYAKSVNADYLFCLHFNMSEEHTLYGAEVWIQSTGTENSEGYRFGRIWLEDIKNHGLFLRGVKTRLNSKGTDYYGILRHCKEFGIPAALLEHAHLDHLADSGFADSEEDLKELGILDAEAVAKYFGLSSQILGTDYSDYPLYNTESETNYVPVDNTEPDMCYISLESCHYETGEVSLSVMAFDIDTPMLYYQYSLDGGNTFSPLISWPGVDMLEETSPDSFTFTLTIEEDTLPEIIIRAHNKYNVTKDSNLLADFDIFPSRTLPEPEPEEMPSAEASTDISEQEQDTEFTLSPELVALSVLIVLLIVLLFARNSSQKNNRR